MDPITHAAAQGMSKAFDHGLSITVLILAIVGLGYLHHVCRREQSSSRAEYKEIADKFAATQVEQAKSNTDLSSAVRELKDVVRFGK